MKLRYLLMAALLPLVLLCSCQPDDPEKIEADSSDMLALAESVLGMKEAAAVHVLKAADLKADDTEKNMYVKDSRLTAFITLTLTEGEVTAVELGKDHKTRTDAMVTERVWSKYVENDAHTDYSLWAGSIARGADTTYYMMGSMMETIRSTFEMFGDYIPESIKDQVYAAMENDNKSFQLALYELDPESISSISEMAYKADISLTEISGLLSGKEVESVSCTMAEHVSGKNTYYRVTYSHNLRENLKLSDLY